MNADGHAPRVGVAIVGLGGAVATTAAAGVELLRAGQADHAGLLLAGGEGLREYEAFVFADWDVSDADLESAAREHGVLDRDQLEAAGPRLREIRPWPAIADPKFCRDIDGLHRIEANGHRARRRDRRRPAGLPRGRGARAGHRRQPRLGGAGDPLRRAGARRPLRLRAGARRGRPGDRPGAHLRVRGAALREGSPYANFTPPPSAGRPRPVRWT